MQKLKGTIAYTEIFFPYFLVFDNSVSSLNRRGVEGFANTVPNYYFIVILIDQTIKIIIFKA